MIGIENVNDVLGSPWESWPLREGDQVARGGEALEMGKLSSGRAAELAGISRIEFLANLGQYNGGSFEHMTAEDIHRGFLNA